MATTIEPVTATPADERGRGLHLPQKRRAPFALSILGGLGRILIAAGLAVLLFVAYQLWGTGLYHSRAQADLEDRFETQLEELGEQYKPNTETGPPDQPETAPPAAAGTVPPVPVMPGDPVGRLMIPDIGLDEVIVEGVSTDDLKKGPGHYPDTPLPGQDGNAALAGHRTTYGAPFYRIDDLETGDEIMVTTLQGEFRYAVTEQLIVTPDRVDVLDDKGDSRLTLTSCHPRYSARERIIVVAELTSAPQPAPTPPPAAPASEARPSTGFDEGTDLSGADSARWPAALWGLAVVAVALAAWAAGRLWRRLLAYLAGLPLLLAALFIFFEQVSRLLPANF